MTANGLRRTLQEARDARAPAEDNMDTGAALYAWVETCTVKAVVDAYARGEIKLEKVFDNIPPDKRRAAPSFILGACDSKSHALPYTVQTVANLIGWVGPDGRAQHKVHTALNALELLEQDYLKLADFRELSTTQSRGVVEEAIRVRDKRDSWGAFTGSPQNRGSPVRGARTTSTGLPIDGGTLPQFGGRSWRPRIG